MVLGQVSVLGSCISQTGVLAGEAEDLVWLLDLVGGPGHIVVCELRVWPGLGLGHGPGPGLKLELVLSLNWFGI